MKLETLLKPVKVLDEEIQRQYAKIRKKIDKKNMNIYKITIPLNIAFVFTPTIISSAGEGFYAGLDLACNIAGLKGERDEDIYDETVAKRDPPISEKITNLFRLPVFLTGAGLALTGTYQIVNSCLSSGEQNIGEGIQNLLTGAGWLSQASSIYLKNSDPKLLDKKPFCKKAYDWGKEKINSLTPKPIPQPVPIKAYSGLEDYVKWFSVDKTPSNFHLAKTLCVTNI